MNQENMAHNEDKNKLIKNHTELTQLLEWADTDIKTISMTVFHMLNQFGK